MLSILIPVYNFEVGALVLDLHEQATAAGVAFEILCYDDGSLAGFKNKNRLLEEVEHVTYKELEENVGRSKIRNMLAEDAQYEQLLFMDCDSRTSSTSYIKNYLDHLEPDSLVYGGRAYESTPPDEPTRYLRWHYGIEREMIDVRIREMKPYTNFMTNNFVVPKSLYLDIRLDESLKGYGHEDTLFGLVLKERGIKIVHIDNPLYHIGLEEAAEFLEKTKEGVRNLHKLIVAGKINKDVKIYRYFRRLKKLGINKTILKSFKKNERKIVSNLLSKNPNLKRFDFYKLGYLLSLDAEASGQ